MLTKVKIVLVNRKYTAIVLANWWRLTRYRVIQLIQLRSIFNREGTGSSKATTPADY